MLTRACLLAVGTSLLLAASAAAAEPGVPDTSGAEAVAVALRDPVSRFSRAGSAHPRLHWGIPLSPFPELEAERKIFGVYLKFEFGRSQAPRRGYRLR